VQPGDVPLDSEIDERLRHTDDLLAVQRFVLRSGCLGIQVRRATQQTHALRDLAKGAELDALIALLAVLREHAARYQRRWLGDPEQSEGAANAAMVILHTDLVLFRLGR